MCIDNQTFALDNASLPVVNLFLIFFAGSRSLCDVFAAFIDITLQTYRKDFFVVTGRFAGNAVSETYRDNIVLNAFFRMRRKRRLGHIFHGLAFPVRKCLEYQFSVFRRDVIRVFRSYRKIVDVADVPGTGLEFRMKVRASVFIGWSADDEFIFHNQSRHVLHDVFYNFCTEDWNRISRKFLICFCC